MLDTLYVWERTGKPSLRGMRQTAHLTLYWNPPHRRPDGPHEG